MVFSDFYDFGKVKSHYLHNKLVMNRQTVLFLHGLGESHLCFLEAFNSQLSTEFNLVALDLPGFGFSSKSDTLDYHLHAQIDRVIALLDFLGIRLTFLVGHSMGGDLGTLLCDKYPQRFKAFFNVEGNLTQQDLFIAASAVNAAEQDCFTDWFEGTFRTVVMKWAYRWPSSLRYLVSLDMCCPNAFLKSSRDLVAANESSNENTLSKIGLTYKNLTTPTVYCWSKDSLSEVSVSAIATVQIANRMFSGSHWIMVDQEYEFYQFLVEYISNIDCR